MSEAKEPEIQITQIQLDEFQFLGIENVIAGQIENADMGTIWSNFFKIGGWNKVLPYSMEPYKSMVVYYKSNSENLIYFIGSIVANINEVPEGYTMLKFPACEFLVITHEWVSTIDAALGQIGRLDAVSTDVEISYGYIRYDGTDNHIILVERENMNTKNGSRYEFWVPIKKDVLPLLSALS